MEYVFKVTLKCKDSEHWTILPFAPLGLNQVRAMTLVCDACGKHYGLLFDEAGYPSFVAMEHEDASAFEIWRLPVVEEGEDLDCEVYNDA